MRGLRIAAAGALGAAALLLAGCGPDAEPPTADAAAAAPPATAETPAYAAAFAPLGPAALGAVDTLATGLEVPWDVDFAPDGRIFVTERTGRIRVIRDGRLEPEPWAEMSVFADDSNLRPESGLMGIALAPDFARTGHVYVVGTFPRAWELPPFPLLDPLYRRIAGRLSPERGHRWENRVYRLTDRQGRGAEPELLIDDLPASHYHAGGALDFGPDGMLYLTTGESGRTPAAQDPRSLVGKVLRYRPDGGLPADNPDPESPVWALGFRNPQGLAWHPRTGELFVTEHGPSFLPSDGGRSGNDELNLVVAGGNYGWPVEAGRAGAPAFQEPLLVWHLPPIAPASLDFARGGAWDGALLVAGLRGQTLQRVTLEPGPGGRGWRAAAAEPLLQGELGRVRRVRTGPDGALYLTTSNRDGRGDPRPTDDLLLRIRPASR